MDDPFGGGSNNASQETSSQLESKDTTTNPGIPHIEGCLLPPPLPRLLSPHAEFSKLNSHHVLNRGLKTLLVADSDSSSYQSGKNNANKESQKSNKKLTIPDFSETEGQNVDSESEWRSLVSKDKRPEKARIFKYRELATATENFRSDQDVCLGHGRFGSIFRVKVTADEVLAVRKLSPLDDQSEHTFVEQVLLLSQLCHPNLVDLIGYCAEGNNCLLVFKYMSLGSLERNLHDLPTDKQALDWSTRMKIAAGVARGIAYLHSFADTSIFAGDLNPSNILLDEGFNPKLSDFGLSKVCRAISSSDVPTEDTSESMYHAPELASTGPVTSRSDTYSFGVILLEIVCGDKSEVKQFVAYEPSRMYADESAVDVKLKDEFDRLELKMAFELAWMCIRFRAEVRPLMKDVVAAMDTITGDKKLYETVEDVQLYYEKLLNYRKSLKNYFLHTEDL